MSLGHEKTPSRGTRGHSKNSDSSLTPSASSLSPKLDPVVMAQQLNGIYIVVAQIQSPGPEPRHRRSFYANLPSAQRAVDRARMNGRDAHLFIGQISIVDGDAR